jgi:hypothetical protein
MLGWFHISWTIKCTNISDGKCRDNMIYVGNFNSFKKMAVEYEFSDGYRIP